MHRGFAITFSVKSPSVGSTDAPALFLSHSTPVHRRPISLFLLLALIPYFILINNSFADNAQSTATNTHQNFNERDVIYFGVLPYLSTAALIKTWRPFADYLAEIAQKKVEIKTAPNFRTFIDRTAKGRYDILMTAPHFAALAVKSNGYQIIAGNNNDLVGDIVVAKDARFQSINDLRNKIIATPDRLAAITMLAELKLEQHGLTPNKNIRIKTTASHNAALIDVAKGRATAAVAVGGLYRQLNASNKYAQLKKLATTDNIPHAMYIASSSVPKNMVLKLQQALIDPDKSVLGQRAMKSLKKNFNVESISIVSAQKLKRLDPVLTLLESKINQE